jgi:hypothetical protein
MEKAAQDCMELSIPQAWWLRIAAPPIRMCVAAEDDERDEIDRALAVV